MEEPRLKRRNILRDALRRKNFRRKNFRRTTKVNQDLNQNKNPHSKEPGLKRIFLRDALRGTRSK